MRLKQKMRLSIGERLALWHVILLTCFLLILGGVMYVGYYRSTFDRVDTDLIIETDNFQQLNPPPPLGDPTHWLMESGNTAFDTLGDNYWQICTLNGAVLIKSPSLKDNVLPFTGELQDPEFKKSAMVATSSVEGQAIRVAKVYIERNGIPAYALLVATRLKPELYALRVFAFYLLGGIAICIILAFLTGSWLGRRTLKPINLLIEKAKHINGRNADERLPVSEPNDELRGLAETMNELLDRLYQTLERTRQFSTDASHELRTPLTILRGEIEVMLRRERTVSEYKDVLASVLEEIDKLEAIVEGLLWFTRIDKEDILFSEEQVSVESVIRELADTFSVLASVSEINFHVFNKANDEYVRISKRHLMHILGNVLDNAFKYNSPGGSVSLESVRVEEEIRFVVKDTGIGIPEDKLPKIFDRFFRVNESRNGSQRGYGLGLAICKKLSELYKGRIEVNSRVGVGTTVIIYFPRSRSETFKNEQHDGFKGILAHTMRRLNS